MKYFKEVEDIYLNKPYIIIKDSKSKIFSLPVSDEYFNKYRSLFSRINDLSHNRELIDVKSKCQDLNNCIINNDDEGYEKVYSKLLDKFKYLLYTYGEVTYENEVALITFFENDKGDSVRFGINDNDYRRIKRVLYYYYDLLNLVNLTLDNLKDEIKEAIDELDNYKIDVNDDNYETYSIPNAWFILPGYDGVRDILYNSTGENGHQVATLSQLFSRIGHGEIFSNESVHAYVEFAKEVLSKDFVDYHEYASTVKMYYTGFNNDILDSTGLKYGLREKYLEGKKSFVKESIKNIIKRVVPKDKINEFMELLDEKSKYFTLLDSRNLPIGYYDIINKIFEYFDENSELNIHAKDSFEIIKEHTTREDIKKLTPETYLSLIFYNELNNMYMNILEDSNKGLDKYSHMQTVIFNQLAKEMVAGIYMAHAMVIKFFAELYENSKNYYEDVKYLINNLSWDDLLVRCCGFNKVVLQKKGNDCYKKITTSNMNYEEEFKEYIEHGWNIDYLSQITIQKDTGILRDMDSYYKVKRFHVND